MKTRKTKAKQSFTPHCSRLLQRKCASCNKNNVAGEECSECKKNKSLLQRRADSQTEALEAPPIVHEVLRSPGSPLDTVPRTFMESRFGHDFSSVRVHNDTQAAESALAVNALAYTVGHHVVFGARKYEPETTNGKLLLGHELTHVIQQGHTIQSIPEQLSLNPPQDATEIEADQTAGSVLSGEQPKVYRQIGVQLQRQRADDPIHQPIIEQFRREQGLPLGGVDEFGQQLDPSDAQIKYQLAPEAARRRLYEQAVNQLQSIDPTLHRYLSMVSLGNSRVIRSGQATDTSISPPVTIQFNFNLEVAPTSLPSPRQALFNGGNPTLTGSGTTRVLNTSMRMEVDLSAIANSTELARNLYHEGLHLLLFMEDLVPSVPTSPHITALANYTRIAHANQDYRLLLAELDVYIEMDLRSRGLTPPSGYGRRVAQEIINHIIEEKYVFDQERAQFNTQVLNQSLALQYVLDGFRDVGVRARQTDPSFTSIITKITRILNDIDTQTQTRQQPSTPQSSPRP